MFLILWHLESCRLWTAASLRAYQTLETVLHVQSNPDSLRLTPVLDSQTQGSYVSTLVTPWRGTRPLRTATTSKSAGRVTTAVGSACCWLPLKATLGVFWPHFVLVPFVSGEPKCFSLWKTLLRWQLSLNWKSSPLLNNNFKAFLLLWVTEQEQNWL